MAKAAAKGTVAQGRSVKTTLAKGARITGIQREALAKTFAKRYASGDSIRRIAEESGRSFGFVHGVLTESGTSLRGRGGATRGAKKTVATAAPAPAKKSTAKKATAKKSMAQKSAVKSATKASPTKAAAAKATPTKTSTKKSGAKKSATKKSAAKKSARKR